MVNFHGIGYSTLDLVQGWDMERRKTNIGLLRWVPGGPTIKVFLLAFAASTIANHSRDLVQVIQRCWWLASCVKGEWCSCVECYCTPVSLFTCKNIQGTSIHTKRFPPSLLLLFTLHLNAITLLALHCESRFSRSQYLKPTASLSWHSFAIP